MDYRALHRTYRPQRFSEIVGQPHVTDTLAAEVRAGTVAHAYLFAGPRGTGKTTAARIIAKALNCSNRGDDGEPCNECASCVGITEGTSLDVIELDAASHNKVEDVREIRANVGTVAAAGGARRVYILDEAHMLSRAASNALLKTLEEPPQHAHFVLATTEPYKLPDTIRSRTQRFDFHPIGTEALMAHLVSIGGREGYTMADEALALIVRHARGSARDALGLLEQVAALGEGTVDVAGVTGALGMADAEAFSRLAGAVARQDAPGALTLVSEIAAQGADLRRFVADSLEYFRGLFLAQYAPNLEEIVDEPDEVIAQWRSDARQLSSGDVLRCIDHLGDALAALREGREERLVVELALLRLTRPETSIDPASLASRLERLEDRVRRLRETPPSASVAPDVKQPAPTAPTAPFRAPEPTEPRPSLVAADTLAPAASADEEPGDPSEADSATAVLEPTSVPEAVEGSARAEVGEGSGGDEPAAVDMPAVDRAWPALTQAVRQDAGVRRHALFAETRPAAVEDDTIVLEVPASMPFHLDHLVQDDDLLRIVTEAATRLLGSPMRIEYRAGGGDDPDEPGTGDAPVERAPDKAQLTESGDGAIDPVALAKEMLGGEIVDG